MDDDTKTTASGKEHERNQPDQYKPNTTASREELERRRLELVKIFENLENYFKSLADCGLTIGGTKDPKSAASPSPAPDKDKE